MKQEFRKHLIWAEGWRNKPYLDSVGKLTIGVGRNLDDRGLSDEEVEALLLRDMDDAIRDASTLACWNRLNTVRRVVVADMVFNMGLPKVKKFRKTLAALERGLWHVAASEMVNSRWYTQTGRRARRLVEMMRSGLWAESLHES